MKGMTKLALGAAVVLLIGAGLQPAQAACPPPGFQITFAGAYVVSNPNWCGAGLGTAFGCYDSVSGPPISSSFDGFWWGQSGLVETVGAGVDNGAFQGTPGQGTQGWIKQVSAVFAELYHYPAFISIDDGDASIAGTDLNWAGSDLIDGCVESLATVPTDRCHCVVLTDQWDGVGYQAVISKQADSNGDFLFQQQGGAAYVLAPIPGASIVDTSVDSPNGDLNVVVSVADPVGGDYRDPNCPCNYGFRVYAAVVPEGGTVPPTREACTERALAAATGSTLTYSDPGFVQACIDAGFVWVPAQDATGAVQPVTPFGAARATATVGVPCGSDVQGFDVYLATSVGSDEGTAGLQLSNVAQNSFQIKCGNATLADPDRPQTPSATPGRSGDAPRGRGNNRGQRER